MSSPRISVVVPFFNNGDDLDDCLQSIATQSFRDLEVIMVDDGSTDHGPEIARKWAANDPRFTIIQTPNGGPGKARNSGVEHARGEFLGFVDGDDMLAPNAYEILLHTLESSGSDFVSGAVNRIGTGGVHLSGLHAKAIKGRKIGTHVSRSPELLYDISVWNKLFRKSFWDTHSLYYPEGVVWEDLQLMTKAHVLATAVDVVPDFIYYWRERAAGELSITQNRTNIQNLRDRITALLTIDEFIRQNASARLLRQHQRKALVNDLWLYVRDLCRVTDDYLREYFDLVNSYLGTISRRVFRTLPATHKLAYYLTQRRDREHLLGFVTWLLDQRVTTIPMVRRHGRLWADLPFRNDRGLKIPYRVYRPHWRDLDPFVQIESVEWQRGNLVIAGLAYVPSVDIPKRWNTNKIVILRPRRRFRPPVVSMASSFRHPRATALSGQERYDHAWAGFRCEISSRWFRLAGRWLTGDWDCFILVRGHGVWRPARLHSPALGNAGRPGFLEPAPGLQVRPTWVGRHLHVGVLRTPARLAAFEPGAQGVVLSVEVDPEGVPGQPPSSAELMLVKHSGAAARAFAADITVALSGVARIRGEIPFSSLPAETERTDYVPSVPGERDSAYWDAFVKLAGAGRTPVTFPAALAEARYRHSGREVAVERNRYGNVTLAERKPQPLVHDHSWDGDGHLALTGTYLGAASEGLDIVVRRIDATDEFAVACQREGDHFAVEIPVSAMPTFGEPLSLHDGHWEVLARVDADLPGVVRPVAYDHARLSEISHKKVTVGPKLYALTTADYDSLVITVEPRLRLSEQGNFNRRVLRRAVYPLHLHRPLRDAVLFVSWKGKQCTDNPRGIAEEMRRRGDDREQLWVVNDHCIPVPPGGRPVLSGTEEYFEALARCRYVISNDDMPAYFRKRDGQVYVQTWHGTPLKRIGFDVPRPKFASGSAYLDHLAQEVAKWDMLLSQNAFSSPILRQAFRFDRDICESGYPRNDPLSRNGDRAAAVRRRLGIPDGKLVVLYAPTWRDNQFYASGRYRFDLRLDMDRGWKMLGDDHVILIRGHHHLSNDVQAGARGDFALNVTRYPDIADLFLISDVLVTDYSSVMFDFAATGRPMVFFTYDLALYRDHLRGFYFDFEEEAPGPLLSTSDEVFTALREVEAVADQYHQVYQSFAAKYCALDDGKAGARVCDRLFGP